MFQVTVVTSKPFQRWVVPVSAVILNENVIIYNSAKSETCLFFPLIFPDYMAEVPRPGSVATSWCCCLSASLNLDHLPVVKKAKGDFDDSELGVDWIVEVVRSENDGCGSSTIPGMELNFYFAVISTWGGGIGQHCPS